MSDNKDSKQSGNGVNKGPEEVVIDGRTVKKQLTGTMFMVPGGPDDPNVITAPLNRAALANLYAATEAKPKITDPTTPHLPRLSDVQRTLGATRRTPQPSDARMNLIPLDLPEPYGPTTQHRSHDHAITYSRPAMKVTAIACATFFSLCLVAYLTGII